MKSVMCYHKKRKRKKEGKNGHEAYREDFRNSAPLFAPQLFKGLKTLVLIAVITN